MWLTVCLEGRLGGLLTGEELRQVKTLRGFAALVETRLAPNDSAGSQAIELDRSAMEQLYSDPMWEQRGPHLGGPRARPASLEFDMPLIDAIDPRRWDQT